MTIRSELYYEVEVVRTGKPLSNPGEPYRAFDEQRLVFASREKIKEWVRATYGNCKQVKMFRDLPHNNVEQVGWIYCFKNEDWSHAPIEKWWQQDWVCIKQIQATPIML